MNSARHVTATFSPVPPSPTTHAGSWPDATNTGYKNAPGYTGSLAPCPASVQSNQTYRFVNCTSGLNLPAGITNVTFFGSRFASNAIADANVRIRGGDVSFDYCSFEPSLVSAVPSAGTPQIPYGKGYQYGIDQWDGMLTIDHSDFWGWGNAIQIGSSTQAKPVQVKNSWFHDARDDGGGVDHTDAILENYGGQSYMVFDHNTIVSKGNTNGLALQNGDRTGYRNVTVTNNYFSGFGYTVNLCGYMDGCSNITFTDNTFGTDIEPGFGPLYDWRDGTGNLWRRNKWKVAPGGYYTNTADDGKYWTPDGVSAVDWTR